RVLCHDVRGARNEIAFRKGHSIRPDDLPILLDTPWSELHLLDLEPGDLGQREAGQRLATALSRDGLQASPSGHRHVLKAKHNGLLKIDVAALQRLNSIPGIAVFTLHNDHVVATGQVAAEAQITPLAIESKRIEEAEQIARDRGPIHVTPFKPRDVIVWMRDDRLLRSVNDKLRWFGCNVREVVELARDAESIRLAMQSRADSGATLFVVSGSNALDPLEPVFTALEQIGAKMQRSGMPVHPGTLLWLASWRDITIIGLPSCGLGTQITAFDLVLPKVLAEGGISDEEITALGHGGMLTFTRQRMRTIVVEQVDEPVR
ncbi:MAG TPA: hypothetical protein VF980_18545, partial [Thermoanaerobaculia bacterium]